MSEQLIIHGIPFNYPTAGESPGWGEAASDWAQAVTDSLNTLISVGDIFPTSASIANNQSSAVNVAGLAFNIANVKSAVIEYYIARSTSLSNLNEQGTISIIYRPSSTDWEMQRESLNDAGLLFSITSAGQLQYTSSNLSGTSYQGKIKFRARTLQP